MSETKYFELYEIHNIITDRKYIGVTHNATTRFSFHKSQLRCNKHSNRNMQSEFNYYGEDAFVYSIVSKHEYENEEQKFKTEIALIRLQKNPYNLSDGGRPPMYSSKMKNYTFSIPKCGAKEFRKIVAAFKAKYLIRK